MSDTKCKQTVDVPEFGEVPVMSTCGEFAGLVRLSKRYVQQLCQAGVIPTVQVKRGGVHHIPTLTALRKLGFVSGEADE